MTSQPPAIVVPVCPRSLLHKNGGTYTQLREKVWGLIRYAKWMFSFSSLFPSKWFAGTKWNNPAANEI